MSSMKKMFLSGVLIIVIVGVIVLINTVRFTSKQMAVQPIEAVKLDETGVVDRFSRVLQFETVSYEDSSKFDAEPFLALHVYLEQVFPRVHATLKREVIGDYSLLYSWKGSDSSRQPILLMSHIDVVPVDPATLEGWEHPPFGGDIADGFIWGRGTLDVKCGAVGILEAVEFLLAEGFQPSRDVYLAFGHDEEIGGANGNARMAATLKERGVRFEYVLDEGGILAEDIIPGIAAPVAIVAVAEKGYLGLALTAQGTGGHSSMPPPQTAVGIVAAAIEKLESHPFPSQLGGATGLMLDYLGPEMPIAQRIVIANRWLFGPLIRSQFAGSLSLNAMIRTTTAATMMEGSVARNVLPTRARAVVNFRMLPGHTSAQVLEYVRATVNDPRVEYDTSGKTQEAPAVSDPESVAFKTLHQTIREVFPSVLVAPALTTVTTDSPKYEEITENIFRFIPFRLDNEGLTLLHGVNERIGVENYLEIIRFFIQQIRNSAG